MKTPKSHLILTLFLVMTSQIVWAGKVIPFSGSRSRQVEELPADEAIRSSHTQGSAPQNTAALSPAYQTVLNYVAQKNALADLHEKRGVNTRLRVFIADHFESLFSGDLSPRQAQNLLTIISEIDSPGFYDLSQRHFVQDAVDREDVLNRVAILFTVPRGPFSSLTEYVPSAMTEDDFRHLLRASTERLIELHDGRPYSEVEILSELLDYASRDPQHILAKHDKSERDMVFHSLDELEREVQFLAKMTPGHPVKTIAKRNAKRALFTLSLFASDPQNLSEHYAHLARRKVDGLLKEIVGLVKAKTLGAVEAARTVALLSNPIIRDARIRDEAEISIRQIQNRTSLIKAAVIHFHKTRIKTANLVTNRGAPLNLLCSAFMSHVHLAN